MDHLPLVQYYTYTVIGLVDFTNQKVKLFYKSYIIVCDINISANRNLLNANFCLVTPVANIGVPI